MISIFSEFKAAIGGHRRNQRKSNSEIHITIDNDVMCLVAVSDVYSKEPAYVTRPPDDKKPIVQYNRSIWEANVN